MYICVCVCVCVSFFLEHTLINPPSLSLSLSLSLSRRTSLHRASLVGAMVGANKNRTGHRRESVHEKIQGSTSRRIKRQFYGLGEGDQVRACVRVLWVCVCVVSLFAYASLYLILTLSLSSPSLPYCRWPPFGTNIARG